MNEIEQLKAENERLKEQMIKLTEENGNLIIRANTSYNNYRDTQRRLDELLKANIHNLALLSKANKTLQEIKKIAERKITYIDFRKSKSCVELEQDYARITYELEQKIFEILQKITKAEEV